MDEIVRNRLGGMMPKKRKMRREYGPADFAKMISGLRQAAEQVYREEFEQIVNPAPVQLRFPFAEEKHG